ncbi:Glucose-responsive transcription factor [Scheffersomyces spartinae]|uniref:Glucose-responsive transcription factor n=1 Tax=Scheffersomyces spartinae TaxID=45513 RepID=A0A9P7V960_9ASCO|nr:Glucose-responsive transcription factor [Scheffersomyces spartinae]KAG7193705.1 Glucose-responsive transcription factor [Scheffersomyces spartinae]
MSSASSFLPPTPTGATTNSVAPSRNTLPSDGVNKPTVPFPSIAVIKAGPSSHNSTQEFPSSQKTTLPPIQHHSLISMPIRSTNHPPPPQLQQQSQLKAHPVPIPLPPAVPVKSISQENSSGGVVVGQQQHTEVPQIQLQQQELSPFQSSNDHFKAHDADSVSFSDSNPPRKRSKVSRACDCCRKKKIKCNAEYSTTLMKVVKICQNCLKNNDECTFSRIPLKRGPSKGYIRDLEEKLESKPKPEESLSESGANSSDSPIVNHSNDNIINTNANNTHTPSNNTHTSSNNTHTPSNTPNTQKNGNSPTIILPPLIGYQSKLLGISNQNENSNPSSPGGSSISNLLNNNNLNTQNEQANGKSSGGPSSSSNAAPPPPNTNSPPIQGPFWKVPYEMPNAISHRRRSSSIDSISSTSTNGSKLPSLRPSISGSESTFVSDSESEDYYSVRSMSRRQSLSPRNSVTSLTSLNGRLNRSLTLQQSGSQSSIIQSPVSVQPMYFTVPPIQPPQQLQGIVQQKTPQQVYGPPLQSQPIPPPLHNPTFYPITPGQLQGAGVPPPPPPPPQQQQQPQDPNRPIGGQAIQSAPLQIPYRLPINPLKENLKLYYSKFHLAFPVLPNDESFAFRLMETVEVHNEGSTNSSIDGKAKVTNETFIIIELFNVALNNLNNFKQLTGADNIQLIQRLLNFYPSKPSQLYLEAYVHFYLCTLSVINYTMCLIGEFYSLSISTMNNLVNDLKIINSQQVAEFHVQLVLILVIFDDINALSNGVNQIVSPHMISWLELTLQKSNRDFSTLNETSQNFNVFHQLLELRKSKSLQVSVFEEGFDIERTLPLTQTFFNFLKILLVHKQSLIKAILETNYLMESTMVPLLNRLATSIMNFLNYLSSSNNYAELLVNPYLNLIFCQLFKMIKYSKIINDEFGKAFSSQDKLGKINNDLSISYNLLNLDVNYFNLPNSTKAKVDSYRVTFNGGPKPDANSNKNGGSTSTEMDAIKSVTTSLLQQELNDGWL